ncbi:vacuolar fusion protein MON1 [Gaertneriomyces semiglobifer]|nr:vacuolar fusion protein MON1 [Gaertneriomyces semiglobifer]
MSDKEEAHQDNPSSGPSSSGSNNLLSSFEPASARWVQHAKHFFILSSAGKPIYTRYGDESKLSSFMGLIQAMISFFAADQETVRLTQCSCLDAGGHKFVFLLKGAIYLLAVSSTGESELQLRQQLEYLYSQIVFMITAAQLTRIFETRVNYDIRNLLGGTESFIDHLCGAFQRIPGYFLDAIACLRMPSRLRQRIGNIMSLNPPKALVYGMLMAKEKLITLIRPRHHTLHPVDMHLLTNMISSSSGFRSAENWTPICLPHFNDRAFLQAYVCYLSSDLCLALCSSDRDAFFDMSQYKQSIVAALEESSCVEAINDAIRADPFSIVEVGLPMVRHFLCRSSLTLQYTEPALHPPYTRQADWKRLIRAYQFASEKLRRKENGAKTTGTYEIYAAFGPLTTKAAAIDGLHGLQKWIRRHEESLFVDATPVI